jgi:uncharacterized glyoxalase superfamily protein PhnB
LWKSQVAALGRDESMADRTAVAMDGWPAHGLIVQIFVEAPDALFEQAARAGATALMPMTHMFFGIREGRLPDSFGNVWIIATLKERLTPEEMQRRLREAGY